MMTRHLKPLDLTPAQARAAERHEREVAMSREAVIAINAAERAAQTQPYPSRPPLGSFAAVPKPTHDRPGPDPLWWRSMVHQAVWRLRELRACYGPDENPDLSAYEDDVRRMLAGYRINQAWARNST